MTQSKDMRDTMNLLKEDVVDISTGAPRQESVMHVRIDGRVIAIPKKDLPCDGKVEFREAHITVGGDIMISVVCDKTSKVPGREYKVFIDAETDKVMGYDTYR